MKRCYIAPIGMLDIGEKYSDYLFLLPHLMNNELYRAFVYKSKKPKILDNGIYEGYEYSFDRILKMAEDIPNIEIVALPDYLRNPLRTFEEVQKWYDYAKSYSFRLMIIIQAKSIAQIYEYYPSFVRYGDYVGVPIHFNRSYGGLTRVRLGYLMTRTGDWSGKPHHLLGLDTPAELRYAKGYYYSFDTSLPFSLANENKLISDFPEKHSRVPLEKINFTEEQRRIAIENIRYIDALLRGRRLDRGEKNESRDNDVYV